jgi:hypothetical protein
MKQNILATFAGTAAIISLAACVQVPTENTSKVIDQIPLRATITPDNHCTVEALGKTYTSIGQVRGAVLPTFTGTSDGGGRDGWHVVGCWVSNLDGSDGDLVVVFPGDSREQPFATGSFTPTFTPPFGSTEKVVSVSFRASTYGAEKLLTVGGSTGAVTVESSPTGARTIRVDVTATKYQT